LMRQKLRKVYVTCARNMKVSYCGDFNLSAVNFRHI
jgi:hypothetical protein